MFKVTFGFGAIEEYFAPWTYAASSVISDTEEMRWRGSAILLIVSRF